MPESKSLDEEEILKQELDGGLIKEIKLRVWTDFRCPRFTRHVEKILREVKVHHILYLLLNN